jgi:hypothetical protein
VRNQGADALRTVIADARDYFDVVLDEELPAAATPQRRATLARKVAGFVKLIEEPALLLSTTGRVASRLSLTQEVFADLVRKGTVASAEATEEPEAREFLEIPIRAMRLYSLAFGSAEVLDWMRRGEIEPASLGEEFLLLDKLVRSDFEPGAPGEAVALDAFEAAERGALLGLPAPKEKGEEAIKAATMEWNGLLKTKLVDKRNAVHRRIADAGADLAAIEPLQRELQELSKQILDLQQTLGHF